MTFTGLSALLIIQGQAQAQVPESYVAQKPDYLKAAYQKLIDGGARDSVLNNMEITTLALKRDDFTEAADAIDRSLRDITKYYGQTEAAAKARSLWYEEGSKEFKGEPYERAMAHYYRGMLDLVQGDYGNAQASFLSGFIQDAFTEEKQNASDFALLLYLNAWGLACNGNDVLAASRYDEFEQLNDNNKRPAPDHDTLVVIETGKSPRKLADGIGHSKLVYRAGKKFKDYSASIKNLDDYIYGVEEDIYFQASTRGARPVDSILDGKINFRNNTEDAGDAAVGLGEASHSVALYGGGSEFTYASSALSLIGGMQLLAASNAKPRADTRYWSGLPNKVQVFSYNSSSQNQPEIVIQYLDKRGQLLENSEKKISRYGQGKACGVVWSLSQNQ